MNSGGKIGYSPKINDPAFSRYLQDTRNWSLLFAVILAAIVAVGFYIYGETSREITNPAALYMGIGIGCVLIAIAVLQENGRRRNITWDGVVTDKKAELKQRRRDDGSNGWDPYTLYLVTICSDAGKAYNMNIEDDATRYHYYQIGDRVRFHAGLNSLEKYDKSKDSIIFCNACASLNDIHDDYCFRCKCPLLK